jgi:hypothetical protein
MNVKFHLGNIEYYIPDDRDVSLYKMGQSTQKKKTCRSQLIKTHYSRLTTCSVPRTGFEPVLPP